VFQGVYFALSRGRNQVISRAELFGRLSFCGFKITAWEKNGNTLYFLARKAKVPSVDENPSYGPLIRLKRVGYQGQIIFVNKLRTMHPYSEYIQDYLFDQKKLDASGKFSDDFRVTHWGKFFRRWWIDEFPQLVNFMRGDMNLVGVRALSKHYFNLYPKDLQNLRIQFKPGLIPPYYADMPKNFDEIVESERNYLIKKARHPFRTDFVYFFKAWYNIFVKHARSS
jgi:hypothetical protein